jgi:excinuclease ABC subunit C
MTKEEFAKIAPAIPSGPGCYKYFNQANQLIYVGKAKSLNKRVRSYFSKNHDNYKTKKLVDQIHTIEFTVTHTEHDALLLENSLIKHYQPRYNILLKDDKTYPYIVIKKEAFPRIHFTRRYTKDGSEYIGPFTDVVTARALVDLLKENLPIRSCNLNLSPASLAKKKYKVCLEYHLGNCKGPCEGFQSESDYEHYIQHIRKVLKGDVQQVIKDLKQEMQQLSAAMKYEQAAILKSKIEALQRYQTKSTVVNPNIGNVDVISLMRDGDQVFVNYMMVAAGAILYAKSIQVTAQFEETEEDILSQCALQMRTLFQSNATTIIAPIPFITVEEANVLVPKSGDKKALLDLSIKNTIAFLNEIKKKDALVLGAVIKQPMETLHLMQSSLKLKELPVHIECFDNSNFQGSFPVAAMVCFKNGVASKKDYRRFHIKAVEGINDFASMSEIVYRRYKRLLEEQAPLPKLVIIDGGKGQLSAAIASLEKLDLMGKLTVVGLAKREESIFFPNDQVPLQLPYDAPEHLLIRAIRDEVHRFGITFHRNTRSKGVFKNELEAIPGIGSKTIEALLQSFKSVTKIKQLTQRELALAVGSSKARVVWEFFHKQMEE